MHAREQQRQEEHQQDLRVDALADLALRHAYLPQDEEARLVLVALHDLLVVEDEHGRQQEHDAEQHAQEQQAAVEREEGDALRSAALEQDVQV